ncbi:MAG: hypothetical protein CL917_17620 [Deltaproteobacteria bacterium]|nr:hypothetical protein [Deltaproteobacteria bacterium]
MRMQIRVAEILRIFSLTLAFVLGCDSGEPASTLPIPVTVFNLSEIAPMSESRYAAILEPDSKVQVSSQAEGLVEAIAQREGPDGQARDLQGGDRVTQDSLLAVIESDSYEQRLGESQSDLARARALDAEQTANWERSKALFSQQVIPQSQYDTAKASYESARADASRAQHAVEESQIQLGHTRVTSPLSGVVLSRGVEVGDFAHQGTTLFQIGDIRKVKAVFGAPAPLAAHLEVGMPIHMTIESFRAEGFVGKVSQVAPQTDRRSGVFDVDVSLPNPGGRLKPGLVAEVEIPNDVMVRGGFEPISVPLQSIVRSPERPGEHVVFVVDIGENDRGIAVMRQVELGPPLGDHILVERGLESDSLVVVRGSTILTNGAAVRLIP